VPLRVIVHLLIPIIVKPKKPLVMNKETVEKALIDALYLLNSELESVSTDDLKEEYMHVISQIEKALSEIENPVERSL
jgi:hypothetical protein